MANKVDQTLATQRGRVKIQDKFRTFSPTETLGEELAKCLE